MIGTSIIFVVKLKSFYHIIYSNGTYRVEKDLSNISYLESNIYFCYDDIISLEFSKKGHLNYHRPLPFPDIEDLYLTSRLINSTFEKVVLNFMNIHKSSLLVRIELSIKRNVPLANLLKIRDFDLPFLYLGLENRIRDEKSYKLQPYRDFVSDKYNSIQNFICSQTYPNEKQNNEEYSTCCGLKFRLGYGGIHSFGNINNRIAEGGSLLIIDIVSAYPTILKQYFEREVTTEYSKFAVNLSNLLNKRLITKNKTEKEQLKFLLNKVIGSFKNKNSKIFSPRLNHTVTFRVQMTILFLIEQLEMQIPNLVISSINTDAIFILTKNEINRNEVLEKTEGIFSSMGILFTSMTFHKGIQMNVNKHILLDKNNDVLHVKGGLIRNIKNPDLTLKIKNSFFYDKEITRYFCGITITENKIWDFIYKKNKTYYVMLNSGECTFDIFSEHTYDLNLINISYYQDQVNNTIENLIKKHSNSEVVKGDLLQNIQREKPLDKSFLLENFGSETHFLEKYYVGSLIYLSYNGYYERGSSINNMTFPYYATNKPFLISLATKVNSIICFDIDYPKLLSIGLKNIIVSSDTFVSSKHKCDLENKTFNERSRVFYKLPEGYETTKFYSDAKLFGYELLYGKPARVLGRLKINEINTSYFINFKHIKNIPAELLVQIKKHIKTSSSEGFCDLTDDELKYVNVLLKEKNYKTIKQGKNPCIFNSLHRTKSGSNDMDVKKKDKRIYLGCFHNSCKNHLQELGHNLSYFFENYLTKNTSVLKETPKIVLVTSPVGSGKTYQIAVNLIELLKNDDPFVYFTNSFENRKTIETYLKEINGELYQKITFLDSENPLPLDKEFPKFVLTFHNYLLHKGHTADTHRFLKDLNKNIESYNIFIDEVHILCNLLRDQTQTQDSFFESNSRGVKYYHEFRKLSKNLYKSDAWDLVRYDDIFIEKGRRSIKKDPVTLIVTYRPNYTDKESQQYDIGLKTYSRYLENSTSSSGIVTYQIRGMKQSLRGYLKEDEKRIDINSSLKTRLQNAPKFCLVKSCLYKEGYDNIISEEDFKGYLEEDFTGEENVNVNEYSVKCGLFTETFVYFNMQVFDLLFKSKYLTMASASLTTEDKTYLEYVFPKIHVEKTSKQNFVSKILLLSSLNIIKLENVVDLASDAFPHILFLAKNKDRAHRIYNFTKNTKYSDKVWLYKEGEFSRSPDLVTLSSNFAGEEKKKIILSYLGSALTIGINLGCVDIIFINTGKSYPGTVIPPQSFYLDLSGTPEKYQENLLIGEIIQASGRILRKGGGKHKIVFFMGKNSAYVRENVNTIFSNQLSTTEIICKDITKSELDETFFQKLKSFVEVGIFSYKNEYHQSKEFLLKLKNLEGKIELDVKQNLSKTEIKKKNNLYQKRNSPYLKSIFEKFPYLE
jgi:hypothetical protein